jgi:molybdopterin converting factor small subunit
MPVIFIPPALRDLTDGQDTVRVSGRTVREALASLEAAHPGVWVRLNEGGELNPFISVVVDGEVSEMKLYQPLHENSEVHFLPLASGG